MPESVNWLHLTDLHLGLDNHSWLWPRVKHDLLRDLAKLGNEVDGWDLVFFTGDLTQTGDSSEFERLNKELQEIWQVISRKGRAPLLCVVPGNHDLRRPPAGSAVAKTFSRLWWSDDDLRRVFWNDPSGEFRTAVNGFFANYTDWCSRISVPTLPSTPGVLPGDFAASFLKGPISLGIVGLNSTFLQLGDADFKGGLDLHVSQLTGVCGDPEEWVARHTAAVLLTHHPPNWLAPTALEHFRQEIYPPGRFLAQLCGHQHEPEAFQLAEAGAAPRRLRQGPSLFGLEEISGAVPKKRIHGYTAGQFLFEGTGGTETLWPRAAMKGRHGGLNICPDFSFHLNDDFTIVTPFELSGHAAEPPPSPDGPEEAPESVPGASELQLLDRNALLEPAAVSAGLAGCPRIGLTFGRHHAAVRQEEQNQFELALRRSRCVWVADDWGSGRDGFLAAALHRFQQGENPLDVFDLQCDEASDVDSVESVFVRQFGMPLQRFCTLAAALPNAFLIFDEIHPELCGGEQLQKFERVVRAIMDYCPTLSVIVTSQIAPASSSFSLVPLHSLDVPDVRTYVLNHADATSELKEADVIEKLYEQSDGLPTHLDRMLRALKVASLTTVLNAASDLDSQEARLQKAAPRALINAVSTLSESRDRYSRRSFRLLQVLSVLPYGETLDTLSHYLPTEPFYLDNALELHDLALLDVMHLQQTRVDIANATEITATETPKILKVPRQVRDFVQASLSDEERETVLLAGMDRFFGVRWRQGFIKLRTVGPDYRAYLASGVGNEFAVINQLLHLGRCVSDPALFSRVVDAGTKYAQHAQRLDRYKDVAQIASALIQQVDREVLRNSWCELAELLGEALRMTGKCAEALTYLRQAVEVGRDFMAPDDKAALWVKIGYAEEKMKNPEGAIAAAEQARKFSRKNKVEYLESEYITAGLMPEGNEKLATLHDLQARAVKQRAQILADNIALDLATKAPPAEKVTLIDGVLKAKAWGYNQVRAIVAKAEAINEEVLGTLPDRDVQVLAKAYSYLHSQRFHSLFDRCHDALWTAFECSNDTKDLLRLFRYSSFLWRIRGDETKETAFVERLIHRDWTPRGTPGSSNTDLAVRYFWLRTRSLGASPQPELK